MRRTSIVVALLVALFGCGDNSVGTVVPDPRGELVTIDFSADLSEALNMRNGNLPIDTFPYPEVLGGRISGHLSYFTNAEQTDSFVDQTVSYGFNEVSLVVHDRQGRLIRSFNGGSYEFRRFLTMEDRIGLYFFDLPREPRVLDGFRILLRGEFSLESNLPPGSEVEAAQLDYSWLSASGDEEFTWWVVDGKAFVFQARELAPNAFAAEPTLDSRAW